MDIPILWHIEIVVLVVGRKQMTDNKIPINDHWNLMQHFRKNMHHGYMFKLDGVPWIVVDNEEVTPVKIVTAARIIDENGLLGEPERFVIDKLVKVLADQNKFIKALDGG